MTIRRVAKAQHEHRIHHPSDIDRFDTATIDSWFPDKRRTQTQQFLAPDYAAIIRARSFTAKPTLKALWLAYCDTSAPEGLRHYGFDRFRELVNDYARSHDLVAVMTYEPGQLMQVDWAGTLLSMKDTGNGTPVKLHVFVAVLPYSGMVFAAAFPNEKMPSWLDGHRMAFEYFGGSPNMVIPDNTSTASNRIDNTNRARDVNTTYQEFLTWYNTAAVPTRSRAPRDKATVEAGVKIITADVIAALTGTGYIDLDEVNQNIITLVDKINDRVPFRRQQQSRRQLFTDTEAAYLYQLPEHPYHQVAWHTRKVGRDFHIEVHKVRYFCAVPAHRAPRRRPDHR